MADTKIDLIIKFGGSAITDKDKLETLKTSSLNWCAELVKKCFSIGKKCIIVHGAGSFGHHHAREYQVSSGFNHLTLDSEKNKVKVGFGLTRQSVLKLNACVVDKLLHEALPAVAISPFSAWKTDNKLVIDDGCKMVSESIDQGLLPVIHGDAVLDESLGCTILSGDTIIQKFCEQHEVKKVVFITDVEGVYDRPPDITGARLLRYIKVNAVGDISCNVQTSESINDVTGGIKLKLQTAINIVQTSPKTHVFISKISSYSTREICMGDSVFESGTEISLEES